MVNCVKLTLSERRVFLQSTPHWLQQNFRATFFLLSYKCVTAVQSLQWREQNRLGPHSGSATGPTGLFKKLKHYTATSQRGTHTHTYTLTCTHHSGDKELLKGTWVFPLQHLFIGWKHTESCSWAHCVFFKANKNQRRRKQRSVNKSTHDWLSYTHTLTAFF